VATSHVARPDLLRPCRALFRRYRLFPEMEEILIEKAHQRTFLYDTKSPDYRDQHMRANASEGIGKELKMKRKFYVSSLDVRIVCPRLNHIIPLMRRPNTDSTPNKPVTLPRNKLLIRYAVTSSVYTVTIRCNVTSVYPPLQRGDTWYGERE